MNKVVNLITDLLEKYNVPSVEQTDVTHTMTILYKSNNKRDISDIDMFIIYMLDGEFSLARLHAGPIDIKYISLYIDFLNNI